MKEWFIAVLELLIGSRQFVRKARLLSLQLAHEVGEKNGLSLDETIRVAQYYYGFALNGQHLDAKPEEPAT